MDNATSQNYNTGRHIQQLSNTVGYAENLQEITYFTLSPVTRVDCVVSSLLGIL